MLYFHVKKHHTDLWETLLYIATLICFPNSYNKRDSIWNHPTHNNILWWYYLSVFLLKWCLHTSTEVLLYTSSFYDYCTSCMHIWHFSIRSMIFSLIHQFIYCSVLEYTYIELIEWKMMKYIKNNNTFLLFWDSLWGISCT